MLNKLCFLISMGVIMPVLAFAQNNLVPNPSFETLSSKPKKIGELDKAAPWISPTLGTAELFWTGSKSEDVKAPSNSIGYQQPHSGDNYAGAIFYDKKNANLREYLQVELTESLVKDRVYCLEFYVSIADLSKHSIDLIGGYFSKGRIYGDNMQPISVTPQIQNKPGRLLNDQVNWQVICGEFVSKGGEKFLTIGNFVDDKQIQIGKMIKPKEMKTPQNEYGYYYIDDVSVIEQDANYKCDCYRKIQGLTAVPMNLVYSKVSGENEVILKPENLIESKTIRFDEHKSELSPTSIKDLDLVVKLLQENPEFNIEVIAYADPVEHQVNASINDQRAQKVIGYLEKQGIRKNRIILKIGKMPQLSGKESEKGAFRKIEFKVIKL
jgi:outer membrane protein OmpA-like peptidoglycan-associated protein